MIDWGLVDEEESAALVAYAQLCGMAPDEFAKAKLEALRAGENIFNSAQTSIGGKRILLPFDESISPMAALIALTRRAAKSRIAQLSGLVRRHVNTYHGSYGLNLESLKSNARTLGVGTEQEGWIEEFLQEIPVINPFSPNIDAFVHLFPARAPKVIVSANLHNLFDLALVPLLMNLLSQDGKVVPIRRRLLTRDLLELAADVILATAYTYSHKNVRALDAYLDGESQYNWVVRHSEIVDTIGALIISGALDFVYLHELAHVVLGHDGARPKRDELEADNLAINCLLQQSRELGDGDDVLASFAAEGAVLLFHFFEVLEALSGPNVSDSHPPALFRRAALSLAILGAIAKGPLQNFQGLNQVAHRLFSAALARTGSQSNVPGESDLNALAGFQVVVIPSDGEPYAHVMVRCLGADGGD